MWQDCGLCMGALSVLGHLNLWLAAFPGIALLTLLFAGPQWLFPAAGWQPLLGQRHRTASQGRTHQPQQCGAERARRTHSTAVWGWTPLDIIKLLQKLIEINFILCHLSFSKGNKTSQGVCHVLRLRWLTTCFLTSLFRSLFRVYWGHWLLLGMSSIFCLTNFLLLWVPEQGQQFLQCSSYSVMPGFGVLAASLNLADVCWELFHAVIFGDLQSSIVIMQVW